MTKQRPIADIYCIEPIPCNPCETSCPFGAITVGEDITGLPVIEEDKCRGCGICLAVCPGLAIRLLQHGYGEGTALVAFPYEYEPLPQKGQTVRAVDMQGAFVCEGTVIRLQQPLKDDPTRLVYLEVPSEHADAVRSMERLRPNEDPVVCRCEEILRSEILDAIRQGDRSLDAIKRRTRAGMGLCQGKTCSRIIARMLCAQTGVGPDQLSPGSKRQPVNPISLGTMASTVDTEPLTSLAALDELLEE